jgi:hypothetical protein
MDQKPQRICVDLAGHYWLWNSDIVARVEGYPTLL